MLANDAAPYKLREPHEHDGACRSGHGDPKPFAHAERAMRLQAYALHPPHGGGGANCSGDAGAPERPLEAGAASGGAQASADTAPEGPATRITGCVAWMHVYLTA
jgi:hypothetical protein